MINYIKQLLKKKNRGRQKQVWQLKLEQEHTCYKDCYPPSKETVPFVYLIVDQEFEVKFSRAGAGVHVRHCHRYWFLRHPVGGWVNPE